MNRKSFDALLLFVLVIARVRIDTLADLVAPRPIEVIGKIPFLSTLLPPKSLELLKDWLTDPYSLLLISITFLLLLTYLIVDALGDRLHPDMIYRAKLALILLIVASTVVAQSLYLVALRHVTGPAAYTHDGGVIQTEEAVKFLLAGKNPYVEDYTRTPMAEWGLDYRTALYHFPYLPLTFLVSVPAYLLGQAAIGWYDQRFLYLVLFAAMLLLAPGLAKEHSHKLYLTMILGLNPIMGSDVIFGQNDSFVLFFVVLAIYLLQRRQVTPSAIVLGLACASKPTAWFLVLFYLLYLVRDAPLSRKSISSQVIPILALVVTFVLLVLPFALWDLAALLDDVWGWSVGTAAIPYQIRGWGLANFVLAFDWVDSRLSYFPFWIPELLVCAPLFVFLAWRQWRENTVGNMLLGYAVLLFAFLYVSRFLNENYLGYILACLAMGCWVDASAVRTTPSTVVQ